MEETLEVFGWPVLIGFLVIHVVLLLLKRTKTVVLISQVMAGCGALLMLIGLIQHLLLDVYGVMIIMLFGSVFHFLTKYHMERR
jgi:hypothetical protein